MTMRLLRSVTGGRTRGNFRVGDTIAPAGRQGEALSQFASRVLSVSRAGYTVTGNRFIPRRQARRVAR